MIIIQISIKELIIVKCNKVVMQAVVIRVKEEKVWLIINNKNKVNKSIIHLFILE